MYALVRPPLKLMQVGSVILNGLFIKIFLSGLGSSTGERAAWWGSLGGSAPIEHAALSSLGPGCCRRRGAGDSKTDSVCVTAQCLRLLVGSGPSDTGQTVCLYGGRDQQQDQKLLHVFGSIESFSNR